MRRSRPFRRVGVVVAGGAVLFFLGAAGMSRAGVVGSKHDFTNSNGKPLDKGGVCSPCHSPHFSPDVPGIWARDLSDERNYFDQTSSPNYVPGTTLLCYDCHDDSATTASAAVDDDPPKGTPPVGSWNSLSEPQDIAFGYSYNPASPFNIVPDDTLAQGGTKAGYYELVNGDVPGGPTPMPATTPVPAAPTGGHYWKQDPSGTPDYASGDKIPCSLCHDPHNARTGSNEAFFLTSTSFAGGSPVTLGDGLKASNKNDTTNLNRSRNGTGTIGTSTGNGREMCVVCHSTSNSGSPKSIAGRTLPRPPPTIAQHRSSNSTACTKCHPHNKVQTSCSDCHGFPPLRTYAEAGNNYFDRTDYPDVENYSGGAGAHQRHKDALGDTIFQCEICHGPNPGSADWHNEGGGSIADGGNVNIMGLGTYWSPSVYPGSITPNYNPSGGVEGPGPGDSAYVFSRMGGSPRRCSGVACHGNPLAGETAQLNWDDDMIDGDVPEPAKSGEIQICKWCHDATPAMIFFGADPFGADRNNPNFYANGANVMGNGLATPAGFGAEVNGHGVGLPGAVKSVYDKDAVNAGAGAAGAAKECTVCHDATYIAVPPPNHPQRTHFPTIHAAATDPRDAKRLRDTINSEPIGTSTTFPTGPDEACSACHQNGVNTAVDGLDQSHHGIPPQPPPSGGYVPSEGDPAFTRACRQCHDVHGSNWNGAGRNLYMVGKWIDVDGDRTADAGESSYVDSTVVPAAPTLAAITTADNAVVFTSTTGTDSFDENDGFYDTTGAADRDDICAGCHTPATGGGTGTGGGSHAGLPVSIGEMRGQNCMSCHDHDYDNNSASIDAFMPSGCYGCHGRSLANGTDTQGDSAYNGQYWPDGTKPDGTTPGDYFDDDPGAHYRHVQALALQLYGETPAEVVADSGNGTTYTKQKAICAFCHNDPGGVDPEGGAHTRNDSAVRDPLNRVTVYLDSDDTAGTPVDVFRKLTVGARASGQDRSGVNGDQAYSYANLNCANLVCHNRTATPTAASVPPGTWNDPPTWTPANAACSDLACHATATYTIAHNTHVNGTPKSYACTECHADNYTVNGTTNPVPLAHGNGEVDMKWDNAGSLEAAHGGNGYYDKNNNGANDPAPGDTGFVYKSGGVTAADPTYARSCYRVYCHGGDNNATNTPNWGGSATSPSPVWNSTAVPLACTSCHATPPTPGSGNSGARHAAHVNNNAWVPDDCGSCHLAPMQTAPPAAPDNTLIRGYATHVDGSVSMAATVTYTAPNCTNDCHLVGVAVPPVSSNPGDWLDTNPLACTDCHSDTYIGTAPTSGLHAATTAMAHDGQFMATAGETPETATCTHCHLSTGPSDSHLNGSAGATPPTEDSTESVYSFVATNVVSYTQAAGCQATCHSDYRPDDSGTGPLDPGGLWRRKWIGVVDARPVAADSPGAAVCKNCHGDFTNTWNWNEANGSTTDHTDPYGSNTGDKMDQHSVCETCHGWGYAGYDRAWNGTAPGHGDGSITMNGPSPATGAAYIDSGTNAGGCAKACHDPTFVLKTNSGWPANYGDFGAGVCEGCHNGNPTYPNAPNVMTYWDGSWWDSNQGGNDATQQGGHGDLDGKEAGDQNKAVKCTDCHDISLPSGYHLNGTLESTGPSTVDGALSPQNVNPNTAHLRAEFIAPSGGDNVQVTFDNICSNNQLPAQTGSCHSVNLVTEMRHARDTNSPLGQVTFGEHLTEPDGNALPTHLPIDSDLTDIKTQADPDYAPCISCHDPHGTGNLDTRGSRILSSNKMMRYDWGKDNSKICRICHL